MTKCQIILTCGFFSASLALFAPAASAQSPFQPPAMSGVQVISPPPGQPQPTLQLGPPPGTTVQPDSGLIPLPNAPPGTIFGAPPAMSGAPTGPGMPPGVPPGPPPGLPVPPIALAGPPNTIMVPVVDENLAWDQIADVVDDYFKIVREQRARRSGEAWTEGRIETAPLDGATWLQPFRKDSVGSFNRWESTLQSIRRRALVRVVPDPNGYLIEVIVLKELEDLPKPVKGLVGPAAFNSNLTLPSQRVDEITRTRASRRWIQLGRDPALEQRMLGDLQARLTGTAVPQPLLAQ